MMKKRLIALSLALLMLLSLPAAALADETPAATEAPAASAAPSAAPAAVGGEKEEVVYANLSATGEVTGVYVVNILTPVGGKCLDYGTYSETRNLTTTDPLSVSGDEISVSTSAEKLYYEGTMTAAELPWSVSVRYWLDGQAISPDDLAGKSGKFEMQLHISRNLNANELFFKNFAVQLSATFDGDKFKNVETDNGTLANNGSDKQLAGIILPGKSGSFRVKADVTNCELAAISVNGVNMSLNIDVDTSELTSELSKLQSSVSDLDDGVGDLKKGADKLKSGTESLSSGIAKMKNALDQLSGKSGVITAASAKIYAALTEIEKSLKGIDISAEELQKLVSGSGQVLAGMDAVIDGLAQMKGGITSFYAQLAEQGISPQALAAKDKSAIEGLSSLSAQVKAFLSTLDPNDPATAPLRQLLEGVLTSNGGVSELLGANATVLSGCDALIAGLDAALDKENPQGVAGGMAALRANYATLDAAIKTLVSEFEKLIPGMKQLREGVAALTAEYAKFDAGIKEYTGGVSQIAGGIGEVSSGASALLRGVSSLASGITELKRGTSKFADETSDMDSKLNEKIDEMIDDLAGTGEIVSFTSAKNKNIASVQFVLQTAAISVKEEEKPVTEEKEPTFLDRLLGLFGG